MDDSKFSFFSSFLSITGLDAVQIQADENQRVGASPPAGRGKSLSPRLFGICAAASLMHLMSDLLFIYYQTDSDSTFETNLGWRRNTGSSMSNISLSSGMASMSSVTLLNRYLYIFICMLTFVGLSAMT